MSCRWHVLGGMFREMPSRRRSLFGASAPDVRVGTSGWLYPPWRGVFYPEGLAHRQELAFLGRRMRTVEINGSFYSLQRPSSYERWADETPDDFVFSVKGGRFITHNKKLRDCQGALANFFASGVLALGHKLGPILWQLPPQLAFDPDRLDSFFSLLPRTTSAAGALAALHDARLKHGAIVEPRGDRRIRHALEVRHASYRDPAFAALLRSRGIALCVADTAGRWPSLDAATSDLVYVRLHGATRLYASGYSGRTLDTWAARIGAWRAEGRDVCVYFDNDVGVRAPYDAINLAARLGYGEPIAFPRAALRAAEAKRGVDVPRATWDRWRSGRRS